MECVKWRTQTWYDCVCDSVNAGYQWQKPDQAGKIVDSWRISQHEKVYWDIYLHREHGFRVCVFVCTVGKHTSTAKRGGMLSSSSPSLFTIRERTIKKRWNYLVSLNNGVFILWRLNSVAHNNPLGSHSRPISFNLRPASLLTVCACVTRGSAPLIADGKISQQCRKCPFLRNWRCAIQW